MDKFVYSYIYFTIVIKYLSGDVMKKMIIIFLLIIGINNVFAFDNTYKIYDYAQVLTEKEEKSIKTKIDKYIEKYNLDMVVVTVKYYNQNTLQEYMDEFYNKNQFGIGDNKDGIIIALDLKNNIKNIDIMNYGIGNNLYSEEEKKEILNEVNKEDKYYDKILKFINYSNKYVNKNDDNYTTNNILSHIDWISIIVISFIVPTIVIIIGLLKNKNIKKEDKADYYVKKDVIDIHKKEDKFITTNTKKDRINNK